MPLSTALALIALSAATTILNPGFGVVKLFTGKMIGNDMARKLTIKMFLGILLLGYLHNLDHRYNWVSPQLGSVLLTVSFMAITLIFIWESCTAINKLDHKKNIARENFRLGVESSPYALILSDANGKIIHANIQTEKLYGYTRQELAGQSLQIIIPKKLHDSYNERRQSFYVSNKVVTLGIEEDIFAVRKDGTEFPIELILTPVKTEEGSVVMASVSDISLRKQQEKIIRDQVIELQVKNQELEHVNYIASHDLQEPLRTVSNYITLLEEDYPDQIKGEIKQHLYTMQAATNRMSLLIRSFLDYGKLGRNRKLGPTNCNDIVNDVVTDLNNLIKCSKATITVATELPVLYAYETELRLLFQNLINNAIKFRKKDATPHITIGCKELNGFFEFYVSDNGIGINCKDKDVIFHIFKRVKTEEEYEGHGIGLANCKKIADIHGGKIWVEPGAESGSTFKFTILNFKA
ncbi:sensor histidine kinase [Flavobacterium zepuense]|nr:ATP-binding protein [Flavobacterium zepuense]